MNGASKNPSIGAAPTQKNSPAVPKRLRGVLVDFEQLCRNRAAKPRPFTFLGYEQFNAKDSRIDPGNNLAVRFEHVHRVLHPAVQKWPLNRIPMGLFPANADGRKASYFLFQAVLSVEPSQQTQQSAAEEDGQGVSSDPHGRRPSSISKGASCPPETGESSASPSPAATAIGALVTIVERKALEAYDRLNPWRPMKVAQTVSTGRAA